MEMPDHLGQDRRIEHKHKGGRVERRIMASGGVGWDLTWGVMGTCLASCPRSACGYLRQGLGCQPAPPAVCCVGELSSEHYVSSQSCVYVCLCMYVMDVAAIGRMWLVAVALCVRQCGTGTVRVVVDADGRT
jgi:hypothetical protein